jgi:bifunctional UDP-N-acetylglucosamine pyrophosphorylase/glucosamine-1-phosphate N-acetyltransferase/UDP-N-acetylglucosamine pyrophosphorylase
MTELPSDSLAIGNQKQDSSYQSSTSNATAIVLAAGKGTRMKSELPKVLFPVLGRPMIHWVLDALEQVGVRRTIVVVGYRAEDVRAELGKRAIRGGSLPIEFAVQDKQLGTGHAVQMCIPALKSSSVAFGEQTGASGEDKAGSSLDPVLVLAGDSPLVQASSLSELLASFLQGQYACLLGTLLKDNPEGLGRIVRDSSGGFMGIVEHKDATPEQRSIREVNMSTYVFDKSRLLWALGELTDNNAQSEYYLTDCPSILLRAGDRVDAKATLKACEALSINTVDELAMVENKMKELGYPCAS